VTGAVPDPAASPPHTARVVNVANALTVFRLLLVPVVAVTLLHDDGQDTGWRIAACVVFAIASVTDRIDGDLARRRGLVTEFGKLADPIADKALTGTALVGLSALGLLPWWVTAVILVREIGVTLLRFWVIRHGVIPASRGGKVKTLVQSVAIGLYLLPLSGPLASVAAWTMALAVVLTVATGVDYVVRAVALRRASTRARPGNADAGEAMTTVSPAAVSPAAVSPAAVSPAADATPTAAAESPADATPAAQAPIAGGGAAGAGGSAAGSSAEAEAEVEAGIDADPAQGEPSGEEAGPVAVEPPARPAGSADGRPVAWP
jgi:CDP-diacylglycerol---glycerol-3-phosphate 3-phosphatidyltransferase